MSLDILTLTQVFIKSKGDEFVNRQEKDILNILCEKGFQNQRLLAEESGYSLGIVNKALKNLLDEGYVDKNYCITLKTNTLLEETRPQNAIILAAGYGMRMVPINTRNPKALIEVNGEVIIERMIRHLREAGIKDIYIVVGFMKEQFEYLIDEWDVQLVVNAEYSQKNNLHSLRLLADKIHNSYIIPGDVWCSTNPFRKNEWYSWYMVSDHLDEDSDVRVNRKQELATVTNMELGNQMIGISYLEGDVADTVRDRLTKFDNHRSFDNAFWEETLYEKDKMIVSARIVTESDAVEINTYEQLRELDHKSSHLHSEELQIIAEALQVEEQEIYDIEVLKKGMTNRSFLFSCKDKRYIMRIPGEGTEFLINRKEEADVYEAIHPYKISDDVIYMNPENGYKITAFLDGTKCCDPEDEGDLVQCMKKLRDFHGKQLSVNHTFDIFGQIDFYESLWQGTPSIYRDYNETKRCVLSLKDYIESQDRDFCLTHIDAVPDNFLMKDDEVRLIDWEYAGMQDPHVDVAMFCIYALYDRDQIDRLIDIYFEGKCDRATRIKIYCYVSACGLLWSNWCEYKRNVGVEFGEYSLRQYRYAKEYYRLVMEMLEEKNA